MKKLMIMLVGILSLASASNATAALITGELGYTGSDWSYDTDTNEISIGAGSVLEVTGDLATTISVNDVIAAVSTFTYDVFVPSVIIWELGGFTFSLDSINTIMEVNDNNLLLFGSGTLSGNGFDDTFYTWEFTGNSITFSAANVSDPSIIALMGLGLIGIAFGARKRNI